MKIPALLLLCSISFKVHSQTVVFINAGSRASWGYNQEIMINKNGNVSYYFREVNGPARDSSFFSLPPASLDSFFSKATQSGFFSLNRNYDGGALDGSGIYISMNNSGKKYSVNARNADVPAITEIVNWLNNLFSAHRIHINYGKAPVKR
jgi:hypothetical protein